VWKLETICSSRNTKRNGMAPTTGSQYTKALTCCYEPPGPREPDYSLPAPDACPYKLITAVEKNMAQENHVNPIVRKDFEAFVKAISVARACFRSGHKPNVIFEPRVCRRG
jgi:hypothetical protein